MQRFQRPDGLIYQQPVNVFPLFLGTGTNFLCIEKAANEEMCMEHYYILRNNQESGPFTLKELKAEGVFASDLVWQDGESNCWRYPAEFDELKGFVKAPEPKPPRPAKAKAVSPQENFYHSKVTAVAIPTTPMYSATDGDWKLEEAEILSVPSFEALKKKAAKRSRRRAWKQPVNFAANLFGLAVMVLGVMMAAVVVKKAVDSIDFTQPEETAEAHAIETENTHQSIASHAALSTPLQLAAAATPVVSLTEKPADNPKITPGKQVPSSAKPSTDAAVNTPQKTASADSSQLTKPVTEKNENNTAGLQPDNSSGKAAEEEKTGKSVAEALQVSANEYSVGLFGGVSNLELTVNNLSSQAIDKALVEVDYLKPNGKVVQTQTVEVAGIAAGSSRKIAVPNSSRGVKVRYRVLNL